MPVKWIRLYSPAAVVGSICALLTSACRPSQQPAAAADFPMATGATLEYFFPSSCAVRGVAFTPDGKTLVSGWNVNVAREWKVDSGATIRDFDSTALGGRKAGTSTACIYGIAASGDGRFVATGSTTTLAAHCLEEGHSTDGFLWNLDSGTLRGRLVGGGLWTLKVVFTPDSEHVFTANQDGTVRLCSVNEPRASRIVATHKPSWIMAIAASRDLVAYGAGTSVFTWSIQTHKESKVVDVGPGNVMDVAFNPAGDMLAVCGVTGQVVLVSTNQPWTSRVLKSVGYPIDAVAFSTDGQSVICSGANGESPSSGYIWIINVKSGVTTWQSPQLSARTFSLAVSNDHRHFASASSDGVRVWEYLY